MGAEMREIMMFVSVSAIPLLIAVIILHGLYKKIPVYETFIQGAKRGIHVGVRILPYLVAMIVAVGMFRASGALDFIALALAPALNALGISADLVPLAFMRSLSGSGTLGMFSEIAAIHGPDSPITKTAAVMVGSSETTFYVLAVYFGSVGITKFRHAIAAGLIADLTGIIIALTLSKMLFY